MLKEQANLMDEQIAARRERARKQEFKIKRKGKEPVYTDFTVANPATGGVYKVAIRGFARGDNYCSCPDFRKNTLGTCKHIEAVLLGLENTVAKRRLNGTFVPRITEVYLHYADELTIRATLAADAGADLKKVVKKYFRPNGVFRHESIEAFPAFLDKIGRLDDRVVVYDDVMDFVERELDMIEGRREEEMYRKKMKDAAFFSGLVSAKLYPYQKDGIIFLACRRRSLLGDDMGLGKTMQAIGAMRLLMKTKGIEKIIIVCPASLKHQWKREIEKFTDLSPIVVEGNIAARRRLYDSGTPEIFITTFDAVRRDTDYIARWAPELIILDEAQRIKNWESITAKKVKELKSKYTFVLTGTPMENKLDELFSIVEYIDDRRLGPAFKFLADHTSYDPEKKSRISGYKDLHKIREKLSPILLRRSKSEVLLQLPERSDSNFFVSMTEEQARPYTEQQEIVGRLIAKWHRYGWLSELDHQRLLCALNNMRMICDSTFLFDKETNISPKLDELKIIIGDIVEEGRKVVIFSQWTRMLEKVAEVSLNGNYRHVYLHGGVPSAKRGELIRKFWEDNDIKVFLSSDAGGVGLNLQAGSAVINVDVPWNPAVLEQRIGRVHRIGQDRNVLVVNMVTKNSIEERILEIIKNKKALFSGVFEGTCDDVKFSAASKSIFRELVDEMTVDAEPPVIEEDEETEEAAVAAETADTTAPPPATELEPLFKIGKDIFLTLASALAAPGREHNGDGPVRIITDAKTGARKMNIDLPPDDVLKSSLRQFGQFLMNIGS